MAQELEVYLAALPFAVMALDDQMRIVATNPAAEALFGAHLTGRPVITATRHPELLAALDEVYAGAEKRQVTMHVTRVAQELTFEVSIGAVTGSGSRQAVLSFQDTTALMKTDQMRRDFVANVSHELKTPLTSMLGFLEVLRGPARKDPAAQERFISIIENEAQRMKSLVHDLLSLSRVESDARLSPRDDVDIGALGHSVVSAHQPMAEAQNTKLTFKGPDLPIKIKGDEPQLRQMLNNLLQNALKYGGAGGEVGLAIMPIQRQATLRGPAVEICVTDQGPGIAKAHIPRLTERFYRVDTHRSRDKGGTGLGLAIVKHVVSRHGGVLKINSEIEKGSRFCVYLPRAAER